MHFATGPAGLPVDSAARAGVWAMDLGEAAWWMDLEWLTEDLLHDTLAAPLYLALSSDGRVLGLVSEEGPRGVTCESAFSTSPRWEGPWFETGPLELRMPRRDDVGPMALELDHLSAAVRPDGLLQGALVGAVDMRTVMEVDQALMLCWSLPPEGVECDPCEDGEVACLPLRVDDLWGEPVIGAESLDGAVDGDGDGYSDCLDCEPLDDEAFPGAEERCNGVDDDCDQIIDEGFPDTDGDGVADCVDDD